MAKRVQLVLNQDVSKLGKNGDLVEVAPGYARNYLIPKGIGVRATTGILKQVERRKEQERQRLLEEKQQAQSLKTALETVGRFTIRKQVGENEAIFGTVTAPEVAEAIQAGYWSGSRPTGNYSTRYQQLGFYKAEVKLHPEVTAVVEVHVAPN
jgi:large subunit ribosomal protein L9